MRLWLFKNFVFWENEVGSKVAGMKTTFYTIFDPTWTHILAPKAQIKNSLNSVLVNKKLFTINFKTLGLTKLKFLKIISFLPFLTQIGQNIWSKCPSKCGISSLFDLNFHSGVSKTTTFCFKSHLLL